MFDLLRSGVNQKPLRPVLTESRDKSKEEFSYHLWHFAAGQPDNAKHPRWNSSQALDGLTWNTIPDEIRKVGLLLMITRSVDDPFSPTARHQLFDAARLPLSQTF
jgi:hypothetical protein